jgi:hypothetical protein
MPTPPALDRTLVYARRGGMTRARFRARLRSIAGDVRLLWIPKGSDTTTSITDDDGARVITWDATVAARLTKQGRGYVQSFNGTDQYGTMPDADNLSFGDGVTDQAFSVAALLNVTDTAAARVIVGKANTGAAEWLFRVDAADTLLLRVTDASANVSANRTSDAAIAQGAWLLAGGSYDGRGGATAADGTTLYVNGAIIASTAVNSGTYVAMENLVTAPEIGATSVHTSSFYPGSQGLILVCGGVLSTAQFAAMTAECRKFFGLPLA